MSEQIISGGSLSTIVTGAGNIRYSIPQGGIYSTTEALVEGIIPTNGVIKKFRVALSAAPGAAKSWTFTMRRNEGDSAITCTIAGASATTGTSDLEVRYAPGDRISFKVLCNTAGNPNTILAYWSMVFVPDLINENIQLSTGDTLSTAAVNYVHPASISGNATGEVWGMPPIKGVVKKFYANIPVAPGVGASWTFAIAKDGVATAVTMTINDPATTGNNTTNTVAFSPGDRLSIITTPSVPAPAAITSCNFGFVYEMEHEGYSLVEAATITAVNTLYYIPICWSNPNTTEANVYHLMKRCRLSNLRIRLNRAPSAGNSYVFTLRRNGVSTPVTVTIADANVSGVDDMNFADFREGDYIDIMMSPVNAPVTVTVRFGLLFYVDPTMTTVNYEGCGHNARVPHADNGIGLKRHMRSRAH